MSMTRRNFGIVTASVVVAVSDARTGAMAMSTNLERFKAIVERGFSQGDLTVADEGWWEKDIRVRVASPHKLRPPQSGR